MKVTNASAFHDYTIDQRYEAGVKLVGHEVKSVKGGHVSLKGSFVKLIGTEAFLVNASIPAYSFATVVGYDPNRSRKLLFHKKELISLQNKLASANLTLVPLEIYTKHGLIKVQVGLARGKKQYEKREMMKNRAQKRDLERRFKAKIS